MDSKGTRQGPVLTTGQPGAGGCLGSVHIRVRSLNNVLDREKKVPGCLLKKIGDDAA